MRSIIRLYKADETYFNSSVVFKCSFRKDVYTPYSSFQAVFDADNLPDEEWKYAHFNVNYQNIAQGPIDTLKIVKKDGKRLGYLSGRGYTSLLLENQLPPGMYNHLSINSLFDNFFKLPNIDHEENSQESYIFVKKGSSMWDGVVNLSYKLTGRYPYIRSYNTVMISDVQRPKSFEYTDDQILSIGSEIDTRRIVSGLHMADIEGNYGTYEFTNPDAAVRDIVRNRYFELDRRFLYDPLQGCQFRDAIAKRRFKRKFFTYSSYQGEDLGDRITFGDVENGRLAEIRITGNVTGITTELSVYEDSFNQPVQ